MGDVGYLAARERAERALAKDAADARVRDIHLELAERYAALAAQETESAENENDFPAETRDAR